MRGIPLSGFGPRSGWDARRAALGRERRPVMRELRGYRVLRGGEVDDFDVVIRRSAGYLKFINKHRPKSVLPPRGIDHTVPHGAGRVVPVRLADAVELERLFLVEERARLRHLARALELDDAVAQAHPHR